VLINFFQKRGEFCRQPSFAPYLDPQSLT
jgi:hypothetical protein